MDEFLLTGNELNNAEMEYNENFEHTLEWIQHDRIQDSQRNNSSE